MTMTAANPDVAQANFPTMKMHDPAKQKRQESLGEVIRITRKRLPCRHKLMRDKHPVMRLIKWAKWHKEVSR